MAHHRHWALIILSLTLYKSGYSQADRTSSTYNGENRITATESITLVPNFTITAGNDVHIFISSQQGITYTYDAGGNRVKRNLGTPATVAKWVATGKTRCAKDVGNNNTGYQEREEKDTSTGSSSYNQLRWVTVRLDTAACPL